MVIVARYLQEISPLVVHFLWLIYNTCCDMFLYSKQAITVFQIIYIPDLYPMEKIRVLIYQ